MRSWQFAALLVLLFWSGIGIAADTTDPRFDSPDPKKAPFSVPLNEIQQRINSDPAADGAEFKIAVSEGVLRLDLLAIPGTTSVAAVPRCIFMVARLAVSDYKEMRFSDEGKDIFVIDGSSVRDIGRQFVWGEEDKGQNPIHLLRLFTDALRNPDATRVMPPLTGSLLGDTMQAMETMNKQFHPRWTLATTRMK